MHHRSTSIPPTLQLISHLEFVEPVAEGGDVVVPVSADQLAQRADQLLVRHTVHVDLLVLVLQAHEPPRVGVRHGLDQTVAREGLLVGVGGLETLVAVGHLAGDAGLHGVLRGILLAELTLHPVAGTSHGFAVPGAPSLVRRIRSAQRSFLVAVNDVLQCDVAFESL